MERIGMMKNKEYMSKFLNYILEPTNVISSGIGLFGSDPCVGIF